MKRSTTFWKMFIAVLALMMLVCAAQAAHAVTYADIMAGIEGMMEDYPQGAKYPGTSNCVAFAKDLCTRIFGNAPNTEGGNSNNGWRDLTSLSDLRPGDYIRYSTSQRHSVVVMSVDPVNELITVAESNYYSTALGIAENCTRYNRVIYLSDLANRSWVAATSESNEYAYSTNIPNLECVYVTNQTDSGYRINARLASTDGVAVVQFPTWIASDTAQDSIQWYTGEYDSSTPNVWYADVEFDMHGADASTIMYTDVYVNYIGIPSRFTYKRDTTQPTLTNAVISNKSSSGYRVTVTAADASGLREVTFPTWQDDDYDGTIEWLPATGCSDDTYYCDILFDNHGGIKEGIFNTHIYAYDMYGNKKGIPLAISVELSRPEVSNITVSDFTSEGYRVSATVTDASGVARVRFPTWLDGSPSSTKLWVEGVQGEGDIWYADILFSNHGGKTAGTFITDVYAYDVWGNLDTKYTAQRTSVEVETDAPVISDIRVTDITANGYRVTAAVTDATEVASVSFTTWCDDDPDGTTKVLAGTKGEGDVWYVDVQLSDHGGALNTNYTTLVSASDRFGASAESSVSVPVIVDTTAPIVASIKPSVLDNVLSITVLAMDNTGVTEAAFTVTDADDPNAPSVTILGVYSDYSWIFTLDLTEVGLQDAHLLKCTGYVKDAAGNSTATGCNIPSIHTAPAADMIPPTSLTSIDEDAFANDTAISSIEIPAGTEVTIGSNAFSGCSGLKFAVLHANVTAIADSAFEDCGDDLVLYCVKGSAAASFAIQKGISFRYIAE